MAPSLHRSRALDLLGLFCWVVVGSVALLDARPGVWIAIWAVFGVAFFLSTWPHDATRPLRIPLLVVQSASALALTGIRSTGFEGILLVLVAAQVPFCLTARSAAVWTALQTAALFAVRLRNEPIPVALLVTAAWGAFQGFALYVTLVARREAAQREDLARLNAELEATQALLAESSRAAERARIARDLHDVLGHHLTALSLRLEVASHVSAGRALEEIERAREIARLLLSDVRGVVTAFRDGDALDLEPALALVGRSIATPAVRIDVTPGLRVTDAAVAETVLRAVQEIVTNAARHAQARRLEVSVRAAGDGVEIDARDDGRGAASVAEGNGLRGMRERVTARGGSMTVDTAPGAGFRLLVRLPLEAV